MIGPNRFGRVSRALCMAAATALIGAVPPSSRTVAYTLAPELRDGAIVALDVTARFAGDRSGVTTFDWEDGWAGEKRLGQWARDLVVVGARSTGPATHGGRIIRAAPGAPLTVSYRVVSAYAVDPTVADSEQPRPVVRPTWFYAVGEALFATPQGRDDAPVTFHWAGPAGIGFASDLQHPRARPGHATKTLDDITESVVIGGRDLRLVQTRAGGAPLRIATIGGYGFSLPAFDRLAQGVIAAERRFWGERDPQPFLVTMTPVVPSPTQVSYSGTGRGDAFALWMDPVAPLERLAWLLGHEYFHSWIPGRLGATADGGAEGRAYWFSEGFTDFYARRLMLRAGILTPEQFAANWNDALAAYAVSPFRAATNDADARAFWTDDQAQALPYQRGAMLAALWDARLRARGDSLDAVLRDQRRAAAALRRPPLATDLFATVAARHGLDVRPDLDRYLGQGQALALPTDTFGGCARVETIARPIFARGWDVAATEKAGVVTGLDAASPAYSAGLRDGMTLVRRLAGEPGDSRVDYVLVARDPGGAEHTIRFRPAGKGTETLQQIALDRAAFAARPATCAAMLAG